MGKWFWQTWEYCRLKISDLNVIPHDGVFSDGVMHKRGMLFLQSATFFSNQNFYFGQRRFGAVA